MSGVFNKLAGVLGFSNEAEDLDDDYDSYDEYGYDDAYESFDDSEEKVRSICLEIADELYNFEVAKILEWCDEVSYSYEMEETVTASW